MAENFANNLVSMPKNSTRKAGGSNARAPLLAMPVNEVQPEVMDLDIDAGAAAQNEDASLMNQDEVPPSNLSSAVADMSMESVGISKQGATKSPRKKSVDAKQQPKAKAVGKSPKLKVLNKTTKTAVVKKPAPNAKKPASKVIKKVATPKLTKKAVPKTKAKAVKKSEATKSRKVR